VVALDVFEQEPLPTDSPMRSAKALLSPHLAGQTIETYLRQGDAMVDEIERWNRGEPLRYAISPEMFDILA
jgi:phosphoglycerate dehydrogenase-like enzyme